MKPIRLLVLALALALAGCGGSPCETYCNTFIEKTQKCGLGGPSGDSAVDQCADQITISDQQCSNAVQPVEAMSCAEFKTVVCEQAGAKELYNCGE
jgi:hypothetical protein